MESPLYGNYWSQPARPRYSSKIPVQTPAGIKPVAKVVQIPVQFVDSDPDRSSKVLKIQKPKPDPNALALRIQKVLRGFLVRRSLKKIMSIRKEVDEIERKVSEKAEIIRGDERERVRVNETLMSLLLKLDSIRGFDLGVRDCRKAVIRKAIALQEEVDSIVSMGNQIADEEKKQCNNDSEELGQSEQIDQIAAKEQNQYTNSDERELPNVSDLIENQVRDSSEVSEMLEQSMEAENQGAEIKEESQCAEMDEVGDVIEGIDEAELCGKEESKRNRELLEKMVEENEKMMKLMNDLCQRNDVQARMLNSLALKVEQLEKAVVCDRLKKKKKKKHPSS